MYLIVVIVGNGLVSPLLGTSLAGNHNVILLIVVVISKVHEFLLTGTALHCGCGGSGRSLHLAPLGRTHAKTLPLAPLILLLAGAGAVVHASVAIEGAALHPRNVDGVVVIVVLVFLEVATVHARTTTTGGGSATPSSPAPPRGLLGHIVLVADPAGLLQFRIVDGNYLGNPRLLHVALPDGQRQVLMRGGVKTRRTRHELGRYGSLTF
mmetsp:Transcript_20381/g.44514  ORF Transcript_20381/g.44514 Transcript_20381/m.44514 type:complete len:209 (-) Transcript_20381:177-803(-)